MDPSLLLRAMGEIVGETGLSSHVGNQTSLGEEKTVNSKPDGMELENLPHKTEASSLTWSVAMGQCSTKKLQDLNNCFCFALLKKETRKMVLFLWRLYITCRRRLENVLAETLCEQQKQEFACLNKASNELFCYFQIFIKKKKL